MTVCDTPHAFVDSDASTIAPLCYPCSTFTPHEFNKSGNTFIINWTRLIKRDTADVEDVFWSPKKEACVFLAIYQNLGCCFVKCARTYGQTLYSPLYIRSWMALRVLLSVFWVESPYKTKTRTFGFTDSLLNEMLSLSLPVALLTKIPRRAPPQPK